MPLACICSSDFDCVGHVQESNLKTAEYAAMLAYTSHPNTYLRKTQLLPQALIMDSVSIIMSRK